MTNHHKLGGLNQQIFSHGEEQNTKSTRLYPNPVGGFSTPLHDVQYIQYLL